MARALFAFVAVCSLALAPHTAHAASPKAPEGEWSVQLKPAPGNSLKGTTDPYPDVITIKDGKLSTEVNSKFGFQPVEVTVKVVKGKTQLLALLADEKHGKTEFQLIFSGKDGKDVTGQMRWGKQGEDGKPKYAEYTVMGTKK